jgi:hypothetical protein
MYIQVQKAFGAPSRHSQKITSLLHIIGESPGKQNEEPWKLQEGSAKVLTKGNPSE